MKKHETLMIALDLTDVDKQLLDYSKFIMKALGIQKIFGIHVINVVLIADIIKLEYTIPPQPVAPAVGKIREAVYREIADTIGEDGIDIQVEIAEGRPYQELIRSAEEKKADLLVVGNKEFSSGSGITVKRVARHIKSDVLTIPEKGDHKIENILVATDFSEYSLHALNTALKIRQNLGIASKVTFLHIIDIPQSNLYVDFDLYNQVRFDFPEHAKANYDLFITNNDIDESNINTVFREATTKNVAGTILDYIEEEKVDLVIVGAVGHSAISNFVFGSVAEYLVNHCDKIPVMVVR